MNGETQMESRQRDCEIVMKFTTYGKPPACHFSGRHVIKLNSNTMQMPPTSELYLKLPKRMSFEKVMP